MSSENFHRIGRLAAEHSLPREEWEELFRTWDDEDRLAAARLARAVADANFGNRIFVRGIVEFSNFCRNDCLYCGLRASNRSCRRFRLNEAEILQCCRSGYAYGFRTFVLQGGEDAAFPAVRLAAIVRSIKSEFPDCAVTLSVGEFSREEYRLLREAGTDRYLLRHESACPGHYASLHTPRQQWESRMECLRHLKELGFTAGCGFMVGSPGQNAAHLAEEMLFLEHFQPHMVGIGPFIPHKDTPLAGEPAGSASLTLLLLSLIRLQHPGVLLPATTALATLLPDGRQQGVLAGANVIMPNLSPETAVRNYVLYDNMKSDEARGTIMDSALQQQMQEIGFTLHIGK